MNLNIPNSSALHLTANLISFHHTRSFLTLQVRLPGRRTDYPRAWRRNCCEVSVPPELPVSSTQDLSLEPSLDDFTRQRDEMWSLYVRLTPRGLLG